MSDVNVAQIQSETKATEAEESRKRSQAAVSVPDPSVEEAEKIIAANTLEGE